ncbi:hypothetical protein F3Y22_tig00117009pilonHSYRG00031 [Hibiscus syriacus]|uniref:Fatty acyl-CoA reductase n=1 Tax=Hibiscus syriacus TaxID=106335 RepID=A0A6A2WCZ6_HIBSY|nr:hypothetical protein F3Y22_tig00117009pilonHSYRG00031 [Hibiscus syriacus]
MFWISSPNKNFDPSPLQVCIPNSIRGNSKVLGINQKMEEKMREDEEFQNPVMELDHVAKFLQGKTILITGATGFLAKGAYTILLLSQKGLY